MKDINFTIHHRITKSLSEKVWKDIVLKFSPSTTTSRIKREREHNNRSVTELNYQREEKHLFRRIIVEKAFYHEKLIKFSGGKRSVYQSMKVLPLRVKYLGQLRPKFPPRREGEVETVCHYEKQFHANVITTTQTSRLLAERAMYFRILMRGSSSIPIARLPGVAISPKPNSLFKFVKHPLTMMLIN